MNIRKYFWSLNENAIIETYNILKDIEHPKYIMRVFTILSQTENAKEVFKLISKKQFIESWPGVRRYWSKKKQAADFKAWWETVYEQLLKKKMVVEEPGKTIREIGKMIKERRINKGWTQLDFAMRAGIDQPYVSRIEKGRQMELNTLIKICKILNIKNISI